MLLLPKWVLTNNFPSVYDSESNTAIEMVAKVYGAMNQLIGEYNNFVDEVNKAIVAHDESVDKDIEAFKTCVTDILEKYIKSIDIKIDEQDLKIDKAVLYMKENIFETTNNILNDAISKGQIYVYQSYDDATENLNIKVAGEV